MKTQNQVRITNENVRITAENVQHIGECGPCTSNTLKSRKALLLVKV